MELSELFLKITRLWARLIKKSFASYETNQNKFHGAKLKLCSKNTLKRLNLHPDAGRVGKS